MDLNNISLEDLEIVISELRKNGENNTSLNNIIEQYQNIVSKKKTQQTESYVQIKMRVHEKIKKMTQIAIDNGFSRKILSSFPETFTKIVANKKTNRPGKILELKELEVSVDKRYQELQQIEIIINEIKQKIININNIYSNNKLEIYQSHELLELKNKLQQILNTPNFDTSLILLELSTFSQNLDKVLYVLTNLSNLSKYRKTILDPYNDFEYNIQGVIIKINIKEKTYKIEFNNKLIDILTDCKINRLKELLEKRLKNVSINEIIEPKYVNETKLSEFIKKKELPLEEILKFDINGLIQYLSLDNEINKISSFEELSKNSEVLHLIYELVTILNSNGFEIQTRKENNLNEEISKKYQEINLNTIEDIYKKISTVIYQRYPNEDFIYSSLQSAYNCINPTIRKTMHEELSKYDSKQKLEVTKQVIEFMKNYSRNKEGKYYPNDEILNFLLQKNTVIRTEKESNKRNKIVEYKDLRNKVYGGTEEEILHKLTRKNH